MAERAVDFLIVGGGMAGAHCAAELRRRGAEGSVLLAGREPEPPYERPPLSKEYLRGEAERSDAYVNPPSWYEENEVELLSGTNVMSLDPEARTAKLQGGDEIGFDKALIATGAMVNILRVEGAENEGIHYLRAFGNSDAIRADAEAAEHVVLIGGSYIGAEVAASLTANGTRCTIVMMEDVALSRTFGEDAGRWFHELLESKGVTIHGGEELEAYEGDGRVKAVLTKSGRAIECDAVVVGAGVRPDAMLAQRAGLEVDDGIVCDSKLQTSAAGIYAAGDCCSYESVVHGRRLRVEHWDVAMQQGLHAARNMLGDDGRLRGCALLLQRPRRLGQPRVRRPGQGLGRGGLARRSRQRRVLGLVPEGRPRRRRASASSAPKTSPKHAACWPTASTSQRPRTGSPTQRSFRDRSDRSVRGRSDSLRLALLSTVPGRQGKSVWTGNGGSNPYRAASLANGWRNVLSEALANMRSMRDRLTISCAKGNRDGDCAGARR